MKKSIFLLLLLGNLIHIWGQADFDDKERERIAKNKVKRQTQWQYDYVNGSPTTNGYKNTTTLYDKNGNIIEVINYDVKGAVSSVLTFTYDNQNNKTSYSRFKGNKETLTYNQRITYDTKGNKLTESGFDGTSPFSNTFTYDAAGKIAEIKYKTDNILTEKRSFKHNGKTTEMTIINPSNVVVSKEITMYDNKNNVLEETKYIQDNITQKSSYSYDPSGKKVEELKEKLGNLAYRRKYTYNPKGYIVQITEEQQNVKPFVSYLYNYDAAGNLVEEKWTKAPDKEYSKKNHTFDPKGLMTETESYNATFKLPVTYRYTYEFY